MDALQFQKAEFAPGKPLCALCRTTIEQTYFHLNGQVICPACAEKSKAGQQRPNNTWVLRGLLYGAGMAALCAIGYAIFVMVTNMEFALLAIAVGYLIGRAVRTGSRGLGGRRCQMVAVALTYLAITISYVPLLVKGMQEGAKQAAGAKAGSPNAPAASTQSRPPAAPEQSEPGNPPATSSAAKAGRRFPLLALVVGVAILAGLTLAAPFLALTSGAGGIISLLIIFLGLQQAWKQTARDSRLLMGPYELEETPAVA